MPTQTRLSILGLTMLLVCSILVGVPSHAPISAFPHSYRTAASLRANSAWSIAPFDYILIILMENKNFSQIDGNPLAPYMNQLGSTYGLARRYSACDHPSLPNYMCLTGGSNYFSGSNCIPRGSCTTSAPSIVDRMEGAGRTWRSYLEDMPSPCYHSGIGNYTYVTNPFVFYTQVAGNSTRCATHVVPANSGVKGLPDDNLVNALSSTSAASNFMWLTPNLCDNMHNCSISRGDTYLSELVPQILDSYIFRTQKAALFITFDEGYGLYPSDYVYTIWAGPVVKTNYQSSSSYSHYSLLKTIETVWDLPPLTSDDAEASAMTEFLAGPKPSLTYTPPQPGPGQTITFNGTATGGASPYSFNWSFGDGGTASGANTTHSYATSGSYNVTLAISDLLNNTSFKSTTVKISDFTIAASSPMLTIPAGVSTTTTLTLHSHAGFTGIIVLSADASPGGVGAALNPDQVILPVDGTVNSTLTFTSNIPGTYTITVHATSGSTLQTMTQTFRVDSHTPSPANTISSTTILGFSSNQLFTMAVITAVSASATVLVGRRSRRLRPT